MLSFSPKAKIELKIAAQIFMESQINIAIFSRTNALLSLSPFFPVHFRTSFPLLKIAHQCKKLKAWNHFWLDTRTMNDTIKNI